MKKIDDIVSLASDAGHVSKIRYFSNNVIIFLPFPRVHSDGRNNSIICLPSGTNTSAAPALPCRATAGDDCARVRTTRNGNRVDHPRRRALIGALKVCTGCLIKSSLKVWQVLV